MREQAFLVLLAIGLLAVRKYALKRSVPRGKYNHTELYDVLVVTLLAKAAWSIFI